MKRTLISRTIILIALLAACTASRAQNGLMKGVAAPLFTRTDHSGKDISLRKVLDTHKAVVLLFYRGQWCPYCNKYLMHIQDSIQMLTNAGAYVVAVTPENKENIAKTIDKTHASFSIIEDAGNRIMKDYDVLYTAEDKTVSALKQYGIDLEMNSNNHDHDLPVPATYIIGKDGKISYVHFNKDYKQRASIKSLLEELRMKQ